ncbi:hypothetical protein [Rhodococcoides corynebacterioides]|uniref:Lipoprotein n=1 Tax=Rhodococcoides corynebacterioides TaxID=53972 RepID=A0ABS7P7M5_9NOCA|nr:hypothetical protein [Rhodococcus corynebacterioides]MBY6368315.1 hypothetical protein [Rhodococcus corynebacterioides]MBY6409214.1 hypothetical protein [Rhodococcus corynebacterioides]
MTSLSTRFLTASVASVAVLGLAACGGGDSGGGNSENASACSEFETTYNEFTALVKAGPADSDVQLWTDAKTAELQKFQPLADTATGNVEGALGTLIGALPEDSLELSEPDSESGKAFVANSTAVADACSADGTPIELNDFPLLSFN